MEFCEHKFKILDTIVESHSGLFKFFEDDISGWNTYIVFKTTMPYVFTQLFRDTKGFGFEYYFDGSFIFTRGIKKDIFDFIELVVEEHPDFDIETIDIETEPIIVFDPDCSECNAELNVGHVISTEI